MSKFDGILKPKDSPKKRVRGKRDDPSYNQYSVYLPKALHRKVKARLVEEDGEISELVERLLREWLR